MNSIFGVLVCVHQSLSRFLIRCSLPRGFPRAWSQAYWIYHCLMSNTYHHHVPTVGANAGLCVFVCVWDLRGRWRERLWGCSGVHTYPHVPVILCTCICVGVCVWWCEWEEVSQETPRGTDNTAVLSKGDIGKQPERREPITKGLIAKLSQLKH